MLGSSKHGGDIFEVDLFSLFEDWTWNDDDEEEEEEEDDSPLLEKAKKLKCQSQRRQLQQHKQQSLPTLQRQQEQDK